MKQYEITLEKKNGAKVPFEEIISAGNETEARKFFIGQALGYTQAETEKKEILELEYMWNEACAALNLSEAINISEKLSNGQPDSNVTGSQAEMDAMLDASVARINKTRK
jgi:hypothetical protein